MAAWANAWACGRSLAGVAGSNYAPVGGGGGERECLSLVNVVCGGLITSPEETCRVCVCLMECDLETSTLRSPKPARGC